MKKLLLILPLLCSPLWAAITLDATASSGVVTTGTTITWTHVVGSGATALLVTYQEAGDNVIPTSVKLGTTSMTNVAGASGCSTDRCVYTYFLANPTSGSGTITITTPSLAGDQARAGSMSLFGSATTGADKTCTASGSTGTTATCTLTGVATNAWYLNGVSVGGGGFGLTVGDSATAIYSSSGADDYGAAYKGPITTTNGTPTWTIGAGGGIDYYIAAMSIAPAGGGGATIVPRHRGKVIE